MFKVLFVGGKQVSSARFQKSLGLNDEISIISCAPVKHEILSLLQHTDLVLLHVSLGQKITRNMIKLVRIHQQDVRLLVTGVLDRSDVIEYIEAGAFGYILEKDSQKVIKHKIRAAVHGEAVISPEVASQVIKRINQLSQQHRWSGFSTARQNILRELSRRETEVLALISQGYSNEEIARHLYIGRGTVKNHVHHILKKLEVSNRNQATEIYRNLMKNEPVLSFA